MNNQYVENFIEKIKDDDLSNTTIYTINCILNRFDDSLLKCNNYFELENILIKSKPKSRKEITTMCYVLSKYVKYLENNNIISNHNLYRIIKSIDRSIIWEKSKVFSDGKFISKKMLDDIIHDIGIYELNGFYYQCLIKAIYEGIYDGESMSVLTHLRASCINDNIVTLYLSDGKKYNLEISKELSDNLIELSKIDLWERKGRYNVYNRKIIGIYPDSCFKFDITSNLDNVHFSVYKKLRYIIKEYLDFKLSPLNIYISGIMQRIKISLYENNIDLEEAFSYNNRNFDVNSIIKKELDRSHYCVSVNRFRENVSDYIETFKD